MVEKKYPCHALARDSQIIKFFFKKAKTRENGGRSKDLMTCCMSLEREIGLTGKR